MSTKTTIDWFRFRTQAEVLEGLEAVRPLFGDRGPRLNLKPLQRGTLGFQQACQLRIGDWVIGRVDFGGEAQRGWVRWDIGGEGCENVVDWDAVAEVEALPAAEIRRADIALTTWKGEVGHSTVVGAHAAGRFACSGGGRPPALQQITSSDPTAGRTCYVGRRDSDKYFRGYEKGFELVGKLGRVASQRLADPSGDGSFWVVDGVPAEDIYRCEVELKVQTRPIPFEVIERRDQYFGGCYPFLADLLPGVESDILMRRPERAPQSSLAAALDNCRIQWGAALYTALACYGGDIGAVFEKICGREHSAALLAAGVLEVDHV